MGHAAQAEFETNGFWTFDTKQATAQQTAAGTWQVTMVVEARKVVSDSAGRETEMAMNEWVENRNLRRSRTRREIGQAAVRAEASHPVGRADDHRDVVAAACAWRHRSLQPARLGRGQQHRGDRGLASWGAVIRADDTQSTIACALAIGTYVVESPLAPARTFRARLDRLCRLGGLGMLRVVFALLVNGFVVVVPLCGIDGASKFERATRVEAR